MVYLLKFGASWVLPPGIFILALFVLSWWLFKKRGEKRAAAVLFALTLGWLESAYQPPEQASGDVIIMLGGGAYSDTPDVDGTGTLCASPASRLLTAVRLQRQLGVPILLSGGQVYEDTGAEAKILVTSAFHMKRSVLNFQKQGVAVEPFPTDYLVAYHPVFHYTKLRPQTEALLDNVTVLQETLRTFVTRYIE